MRTRFILVAISSLFIFTIVGCANQTINSEVMYEKSSFLTKLTRKVQVGVRKNINNEEELYSFISKKFPNEMDNFSQYSIRMKNDNGIAVVLMCNKEKTKALIEDAVCKAEVEGYDLYTKELPCEFQLNIEEVCKKD
ncbi:hypothetical protein [Arcobacter sp.]|uniref:hypothetical protein n=1 Tax=Arcobacter sp. TaxID=1872629 RepID=UPI003D0DE736